MNQDVIDLMNQLTAKDEEIAQWDNDYRLMRDAYKLEVEKSLNAAKTTRIEHAKVEKLREAILPFVDHINHMTYRDGHPDFNDYKKLMQALTDTEEK